MDEDHISLPASERQQLTNRKVLRSSGHQGNFLPLTPRLKGPFGYKTCHQWQIAQTQNRLAISQSISSNSVAFNNNCKLLLIANFMKQLPGLGYPVCPHTDQTKILSFSGPPPPPPPPPTRPFSEEFTKLLPFNFDGFGPKSKLFIYNNRLELRHKWTNSTCQLFRHTDIDHSNRCMN